MAQRGMDSLKQAAPIQQPRDRALHCLVGQGQPITDVPEREHHGIRLFGEHGIPRYFQSPQRHLTQDGVEQAALLVHPPGLFDGQDPLPDVI